MPITNNGNGSDRFWKLWERIKEDRKSTDVIVQMSRSSVIFNIVDLIREGAITLDDLAGFSEKLQAQVQFFIKR